MNCLRTALLAVPLATAIFAVPASAETLFVAAPDKYMVNDLEVGFTWNFLVDTETDRAILLGASRKSIPSDSFKLPSIVAWADGPTTNSCTVKEIAPEAFAGQNAVTAVAIPPEVEIIGAGAFSNCTVLSSVEIPYGVRYIGERAFMNTIITELAIPDSLLDMGGNIGAGALFNGNITIGDSSHFCYSSDGVLYNKDMTKLYACPTRAEGTINIPSTVTNICTDAFFGCNRLKYLNLPAAVRTVGNRAFNVSGIWSEVGAPEGGARLESVFFQGGEPDSAGEVFFGAPESLAVYAFDDAWPATWEGRDIHVISAENPPVLEAKIDDITWLYQIVNTHAVVTGLREKETSGVIYAQKIGEDTWEYARGLKIPDTINGYAVTVIETNAFDGCANVTAIGIPDTVTEIGASAFRGCTSLKAIDSSENVPFACATGVLTLNYGVRKIGRRAFDGTLLQALSIPDSVIEIDGNPIAGCNSMTSVSVSTGNAKFKSVDGILYNRKGTRLVAVPACIDPDSCDFTIPDGVIEIGDEAFAGCETVENITVPATVDTVGARAFADNGYLQIVSFLGDVPNAADDIYEGSESAVSCYTENSSGWPTGGSWKDRPLVSDGEAAWSYTIADGAVTITGMLNNPGVVTIPATLRGLPVTAIEPKSFNGVSGITSFSVDPANKAFSAKNGILYSKDGKTLVRVPDTYLLDGTKTETVSEAKLSVTIVPAVAPDGTDGTTYTTNSTLSTPTITTTTESIKGTVASRTLLNGVSTISDYAFYGCCNSYSNTTVSTTNQESGVTGFIGDSVYVKTISTVRSVVTKYDFALSVGDNVTCGARAFDGTPVSRGKAQGEQPGTGGGSGGPDPAPSGNDPLAALEAKSDYTGYLLRNGVLSGSVTVKTGAISRGKMKVTAKRQLLGGKKQTIKDLAQFVPAGCTLVLAKTDKKTKAFDGYKGKVWTIALGTIANGGSELLNGYSALSVSVAAKGKAKLTGYLGDGTRVSVSAQMMTVDGRVKIPFFVPLYSGKKGGFSMLLDVTDGLKVEALSDLTAIISRQTFTAVLIEVATGVPAASFSATVSFADSEIPEDYTIDPSVGNWKLRYTAKTGLVKGSFKAVKGNRKVTVSINGVVIDGIAWCSGLIKKVASLAICAD